MKKIIFLSLFGLSACSAPVSCPRQFVSVKCDDISTPREQIYMLHLENASIGQEFFLQSRNSIGMIADYGLVHINHEQNIMYFDGAGFERQFSVNLKDYRPGEYINFYLQPRLSNTPYVAHIVPYPITVSQGGFTVHLERDDRLGHSFRIVGEGFEPFQNVSFLTYGDSSIYTNTIYTDARGRFESDLNAWTEGKNQGSLRVEISAADENMTLYVPWGHAYWNFAHQHQNNILKEQEEYDYNKFLETLGYEVDIPTDETMFLSEDEYGEETFLNIPVHDEYLGEEEGEDDIYIPEEFLEQADSYENAYPDYGTDTEPQGYYNEASEEDGDASTEEFEYSRYPELQDFYNEASGENNDADASANESDYIPYTEPQGFYNEPLEENNDASTEGDAYPNYNFDAYGIQ